jgi:hypothetical protein
MHVVAHYRDGRVVKGTSLDLDPGRPVCHVAMDFGPLVKVALKELKALYVVRTLAGDRRRSDRQEVEPDDLRRRGAHAVEVTFADGEQLVGLTLHHPIAGEHFFLLPADPESNNVRILVNRGAVSAIREVSGAALARA